MKIELEHALRKFLVSEYASTQLRKGFPPTVGELNKGGITKKQLRNLEKLGLCKAKYLPVTNGKASYTRACFELTGLGHEVCNQLNFEISEDIISYVAELKSKGDKNGDIDRSESGSPS